MMAPPYGLVALLLLMAAPMLVTAAPLRGERWHLHRDSRLTRRLNKMDDSGSNLPPPTDTPTPLTDISPSTPPDFCTSVQNDQPFQTTVVAQANYVIETTSASSEQKAQVFGSLVNSVVIDTIYEDLVKINCEGRRRRLAADNGLRGVQTGGSTVLDSNCQSHLQNSSSPCFRIQSRFEYYLDESANKESVAVLVQSSIESTVQGKFTSNDDTVFIVSNATASTSTSTGSSPIVSNANSPQTSSPSSSMPPVGIVFLVFGVVLVLAGALLLIRRRQKTNKAIEHLKDIDQEYADTFELSLEGEDDDGTNNGKALAFIYGDSQDDDIDEDLSARERKLSKIRLGAPRRQATPEVTESFEISEDGRIRSQNTYSMEVVGTSMESPLRYTISDTMKL